MPDYQDTRAYDFHRLSGGGRIRYAIRNPATTARATIVIAPGRREFIEKKFFELGQPFLDLGCRILMFEWRGQGLSDRFLSGRQTQRDHILDFTSHLSDFDSFFQEVVKPNTLGPLILCGHSMGSHLLLRWLADRGEPSVAATIVTAPMLALGSLPVHGLAQAVSWLEVKLGHAEHYATSQHDYDERDQLFAGNPLSQDEARFKIMERYFTAQPEMTVGGITWGWLLAALRSIHELQRPSFLKRIACPVLSITGGKDGVTPPQELAHYLKYIPRSENIVIPGALHDIMNERPVYRDEAWKHINGFLAKAVK
jgi:lysophospholipase